MGIEKLGKRTLIHDKDIAWEDLGSGVQRKIMAYDENLMMVKVEFEKSAVGNLHHHPHRQMTFVAKGSFEVTVGDEKKILNEGDVFFARPDVPHGVVCLATGLLIDLFNPHREDFLKEK